MQAKDLSDYELISLIKDLSDNGLKTTWATRFDIERSWPKIPPKVIRAKLKSLIKRGLVDGCVCGCRGDFEVLVGWVGEKGDS